MSLSRTHGLVAVAATFTSLREFPHVSHGLNWRYASLGSQSYLDGLRLTSFENLLDNFVLVCRAEFVLKASLGCAVQLTLSAMLVRHQDLERVDHLGERDGFVLLPLFKLFWRFDEDDEIIGVALVEDFGDGAVSASHFDGVNEVFVPGREG